MWKMLWKMPARHTFVAVMTLMICHYVRFVNVPPVLMRVGIQRHLTVVLGITVVDNCGIVTLTLFLTFNLILLTCYVNSPNLLR